MSSVDFIDEMQNPPQERLGLCEACNANVAKYTCPRCEVKSCSLTCLNLHKRELKCDGIRDRTKYIPLVKMTKVDLMNDYYFLEECTKFVEDRKRDHRKRFTCYNKNLPAHLFRLRQAAADRGTMLRILLQNFSKRQKNTTYLEFKSGKILWRIEWCFPNGNETLVFIDENINEDSKLHDIVDKYLEPASNNNISGINKLSYYQARGISGVQLLLKAEGIKQCRNRVIPLNVHDTLREALRGKTVVEFPTIYVVFKDQAEQFDIVDSDDDLQTEMRHYKHYMAEASKQTVDKSNIANIEGRLDKMQIQQMKRCKPDHGEPSRKKSSNFLFSDEQYLNQLSESDAESSTEEATTGPKQLKLDSPKKSIMED